MTDSPPAPANTDTPATGAAPATARIFLVDDHPVVRQGIARMIDQEPGLSVCGEAETAAEAVDAIAAANPTLVLVDLTLPDKPGLELIKDLKAKFPTLKLLVLSMHEESIWAERVLRAGACGYVMKQEKPRVLIERIRQALAGGISLSDAMQEQLLRKLTGQRSATVPAGDEKLGDREMEVLQLIGQGMSTRDIAASLHISVKTVEAHRENLKRKLNLASGAELLRFAVLRFVGQK